MYQSAITSQDEAICHLFLHCCFKDGTFTQPEVNAVSAKFVDLQIHRDLNFKNELQQYRSYKNSIANEAEYLKYLIKLIHPVHTLALYTYCTELCLSDALLSASEEILLKDIALILEIDDSEKITLDKLLTQRKAVEMEKIF